MMAGEVLIETEMRTNENTGNSFHWALVRTAEGMEVDAVIHPYVLYFEGIAPPQVGEILACCGKLSRLFILD
jgi:hypothetical protein